MSDPLSQALALRERYRDDYHLERDPIREDRLLWRAQSVRQIVHLVPGLTILELGAGHGAFTLQLQRVSRGENPITAIPFGPDLHRPEGLASPVEWIRGDGEPLSRLLEGRKFDVVVGIGMLDRGTVTELLRCVHDHLEPGGQAIFIEPNPWNPVLRLRRLLSRSVRKRDPRRLLSRPRLYELLSEIGFVRNFAIFNDFVYAPLTRSMVWMLRNFSILLENTPGIRTLAGAILIHAQKPPIRSERRRVSLCDHASLRGAVSVVIPCHDEEMNVGPLVEGLIAHYGDYLLEVIPVDDGSRDGTAQVVRELARLEPKVRPLHREPPNGVGLALRDGLRAARGRYVLTMDCDFQHLLPELRDLFDAAEEGCDIVVGSRFSRHSVLLNYPLAKILFNRGFHVLVNLLFHRHCRDLTNNLKLMTRETAARLELTEPGFAINAETGLQPFLLHCRLKEVPISWIDRSPDMGASSFDLLRDGGGYLRVLSGLAWRTRFGFQKLITQPPRSGPGRP